MVRIRLKRVGKKKQPSYRVVIADSRSPRDGRIIESIGHYHPRQEPSEVVIDSDRAVYWLSQGAQPSQAVAKLLRISGAWASFTGEPTPEEAAASARARATPAAAVRATPAESVAEDSASPESDQEEPAPESDQEAAAPEAESKGG